MITRREMMLSGTMAGIWALHGNHNPAERRGRGDPLIHITDLYHPPQDPDDHFDLATIAALPELELRGVILDATRRFLEPAPAGVDISRDPGFTPVAQIAYLLGKGIPAGVGPTIPLESPEDDISGRTVQEQGGVRLFCDLLDGSREPVLVSVVGSARVVTAAFNRHPQLLKRKIRAILLNAGSTGGKKQEWNVGLDPAAYIGLWRSKLPIDWYPCSTEGGAFNDNHERGTFWKATHAELLSSLSPPFRAWFAYALSGSNRSNAIGELTQEIDPAIWETLLGTSRNLWSTASLVMGAGRVLAKTSDGWRFVRGKKAEGMEAWPWRLDPIEVDVPPDGNITWRVGTEWKGYRLFGRRPGVAFGRAMAEALSSLLASLPPPHGPGGT